AALLGRSLDAARAQRDEAERQRTRAEAALGELAAAQAQLVDAARSAGMAEIAAGVLHNVGNVLTSVNVAAGSAHQRISGLPRLDRAIELLREQPDLAAFWASPRGPLFPEYLERVSSALERAIGGACEELTALQSNIDHIRRIVATQQE